MSVDVSDGHERDSYSIYLDSGKLTMRMISKLYKTLSWTWITIHR